MMFNDAVAAARASKSTREDNKCAETAGPSLADCTIPYKDLEGEAIPEKTSYHFGNGLCSSCRWHPNFWQPEAAGRGKQLIQLLRVMVRERINIKNPGRCHDIGKGELPIYIERDTRATYTGGKCDKACIEQTTPGQSYLLYAIGETSQLVNDPDDDVLHGKVSSFVNRVRNRYGSRLHRAPAFFTRKFIGAATSDTPRLDYRRRIRRPPNATWDHLCNYFVKGNKLGIVRRIIGADTKVHLRTDKTSQQDHHSQV